jgi:hypothetical protein
MASKKPDLDDATINVARRLLTMLPKHHADMKVGRPKVKKRRGPKARAASAKQRNV